MLYKPNFCCNCGEKIERVEWNLLTSRRFCETCAAENRRYDHAPRALVAAGALAVMFGFGSFWGGSGSVGQQASSLPATFKSTDDSQKPQARTASDQEQLAAPIQPGTSAPPSAERAEMTTVERRPAEPRFFCGALTKKGTPCSRKVKARGTRCYQHEGRPEAPPMN